MTNSTPTIKIYGLKNCDSCRKVHKSIAANHDQAELVDVRQQPLTKTQLTAWCKEFGREKLVNRRSTTWRQLSDNEKELASDNQAVALLLEHPSLMKRPVITSGKRAMLGNDINDIIAFLKP